MTTRPGDKIKEINLVARLSGGYPPDLMQGRVKASVFQSSTAIDTGRWVERLGLKQWQLAAMMVSCRQWSKWRVPGSGPGRASSRYLRTYL